jgi:hypothetical protein
LPVSGEAASLSATAGWADSLPSATKPSCVTDAVANDGDLYTVLDVLAQNVGVIGVFSDWPATVTYDANCMGLK